MTTSPDYWALLASLNIPSTYKVNRSGWRLESHGSHTVNGVQLIPGAPGFNAKAAYLMWTSLFGAHAAATPLTLMGTNGNDTLTGGTENDTFTGGAGADSLIGGGGNDNFNVTDTASDGNDTIDGGAGTGDTIVVAAGQTIVFAANDAVITGVENITLGAGASVTLTGQLEAFNITASTGNETVVGGSGNDTINAGAGADSITGGAGADSITGGAGADVIDVGNNDSAVDTVRLAASAESFVGAITSGTTNLSASIDVVSNLAVGDRFDLTALGLNGSINGAAVTSNLAAVITAGSWGLIRGTYVGGVFTENTGTDTHTLLVYDADGAGGGSNLGAVVLVGLFGGSAVNGMVTLAAPTVLGISLTGTSGNDTLTGTAGDDTFEGLAGADSLIGGGGNDNFNVTASDGNDTIDGGAGTGDTIAVAANQVIVFAANDAIITGVENVTLGAAAGVTLTGQLEAFDITASTGNETVVGGDGNDTITGGAGADSINAGAGTNTVTDAGQGTDTITHNVAGSTVAVAVTGTGTVTLTASQSGATATSAAGVNTTINASTSTAAVTLNGNSGNDALTGGSGADTIAAGAGNDTIAGGGGADNITGGGGADTIDAGSSDAAVDTVVLAASADSFVGAITSGTTNLSASIDVVNNLAVGDQFDLRALVPPASINGAAVTSNLAAVTTAGSWGLIRGTYVGGVFTENTGTDTHTLLVYDADGAGGGSNLGAVVLVGLFGGSAVNGMVTLAAPTVLGISLTGTSGNDTLTGTADDDTLEGLAGADSLIGDAGNDTFNATNTAADGSDTINGGDGIDTIAVAAGQVIAFTVNNNILNVENVTLGVGSSLTLTNQTEPFNITASSGNETVVGGNGNDTITGGEGADSLNGGSGNDLFNVTASDGNDTIIGMTGIDTIAVAAGSSVAFSVDANLTGIENISLGAGAGVTLTGQTEAFTITGTTGAERIDAGSGATTITGGGGADTLTGGAANDSFVFSSAAAFTQAATVIGGLGTDRLQFDNSTNPLTLADADFAKVTGFETLQSTGNSLATITLGTNSSAAFATGITISTSAGTLNVQGALSTVPITVSSGTANNDTLIGSAGADSLIGGSGNDTIFGGDGNDTVRGGSGNDTLAGGAGDDLFLITESSTGDLFDGGDGNDTLNVTSSNPFPTADVAITNIENITLGSNLNVSIVGQTEGFRITGGSGNNIVALDSGTQLRAQITVVGGGGSDTLEFQNGANPLTLDDLDFVNVTAFSFLRSTGTGFVTASLGANFSAAFPLGTTFTLTNATVTTVNLQGALATVPIALTAGNNNDTLIGGTGSDSLLGSGGDDTLIGNGGNDTLGGGTGNDSVDAGPGNDTVNGDDGDDTLIGGEGSDTLDGGLGNDSIHAGTGDDTVTSGDGDDTMVGGEGSDSFLGGNGADRLVLTEVTPLSDIVNITANVATPASHSGTVVLATANNDDLGADTIVDFDFTSANADVFVLTVANMSSFAHGTNTTMGTASGGATGSAAAYASNVGLIDLNANGIFSDTGDIAMTFSGNVPTEAQLESRIQYLMTGTSSSDNLTGGVLADSIDGGSGNDTLIGGSGNDTLFGGPGVDSLIGGDGDDVFFYASNSDNSSDDIVVGGNGTDTIVVAAGVSFNPNTSFTNPPIGIEKILLGVGASTILNGMNQGYEIICSTGNEIGTGGHGNDTISGGDGNDNLFGGLGIDIISGDGGNDTLHGWDGNDTLSGGAGIDSLTGGAGSDVFVYTTASDSNASTSIDRITDLVLNGATGDRLDFTLTGTLTVRTATVAFARTAADTISEITGLFNSTNGSEDASEEFTGGGNATAILATMTDATLLVVDVDGDGAFTTSDVVINVTGVTATSFTTACFI